MMEIILKKGNKSEKVSIDERNVIDVLTPKEAGSAVSEEEILQNALDHPIGTKRMEEIFKPGETVAVITSDETRPMPSSRVLSIVLDRLKSAGIEDQDITVFIARGSHRHTSDEERRRLVGDAVFDRVRCVDSDSEQCVRVGMTRRGTPVDIDQRVVEADRRICLGNIEFHYFAGYSGGAKAIMPGVSTPEAIQANHRLLVDPDACIGKLEGNPLREDLEEGAAMVGADFILNVILDAQKRIIAAYAGDMIKAHRAGCRQLDDIYRFRLNERADIVIVSNGGAPKDLNLYQSQKALENARHAVRKGGIIILVASCREGLGNAVFEQWMKEADTPESIVERLHRGFRLGGHKAAMIALVLEEADVYLVSDMSREEAEEVFMAPFQSAQEALDQAFEKLGRDARVLIMPYGGSTVPAVTESDN